MVNRPRSIYQYSSIASRLSGQNCKFFKFLLSSNSQKRLRYKENNTKYRSLTRKPRSHVRILIYRTWPIASSLLFKGQVSEQTTAFFKVSFSHLHYNVIQRGNFGLNLQNSPKLSHIHARFYCNTNEQS